MLQAPQKKFVSVFFSIFLKNKHQNWTSVTWQISKGIESGALIIFGSSDLVTEVRFFKLQIQGLKFLQHAEIFSHAKIF